MTEKEWYTPAECRAHIQGWNDCLEATAERDARETLLDLSRVPWDVPPMVTEQWRKGFKYNLEALAARMGE
jgi:hypothetical protein